MDSASGRLLDHRYRLGAVLGRGGMATVYAATDTKLRRPVAVKLFHPGADDEHTCARLAAEATLLGGLSHPGLLKVFDMSIAAGEPYLFDDYLTRPNRAPDPPTGPPPPPKPPVRLPESGWRGVLRSVRIFPVL